MAFRTKIDFSSNRQVKQRIETFTSLSGGTRFGVPFSSLPTGPDLETVVPFFTGTTVLSTFSGNSASTIYSWYYPQMNLALGGLSAITPTNSGITQNASAYTATSYTTIDGNTVATAYSGVSFDITPVVVYNLGGGNYSGSVQTATILFLSAGTLDFTGRTIWNDVSGITRTQDLIITRTPIVGATWTCIDGEGKGSWIPASAATSGLWVAGTGPNSVMMNNGSNVSSGNLSVAEGHNSQALGAESHAEGDGCIAWLSQAHAEGQTTQAIGSGSHAEGQGSLSFGDFSHAEGIKTFANITLVYGTYTSGTTNNSHFELWDVYGDISALFNNGDKLFIDDSGSNNNFGVDMLTYNVYSSVYTNFGSYSATVVNISGTIYKPNDIGVVYISNVTTPINNFGGGITYQAGHAEGYKNLANGYFSHAEGEYNIANGNSSHAEGGFTITTKEFGHAEGRSTIAFGVASHAQNTFTKSIGDNSHAEGSHSISSGDSSHAEGVYSLASGIGSHAEGGTNTPSIISGGTASGNASHAEGILTLASGEASHAEGYKTIASGTGAHAECGSRLAGISGGTASGQASHAEGYKTLASGIASHAQGTGTTASGNYSHAEGDGTTARGAWAHAQGSGTYAGGNYSFSSGVNTNASGTTSFVHGTNSNAAGATTIVLGDNITGTTANTTYVASLNIKTVGSTASVNDIRIDANGNLTTNVSDERLKENITPLSGALSTIKALQGVSYQWKDREAGTDAVKLGFIAQQVNAVDSRLAFTNPVDGYMGLHIDGVIPLLVESVKDLDNSITSNDLTQNKITIPSYTPTSSTDTNGNLGNVTIDDDYLYIKTSTGWKRTNLESF
jgi:hypothetical protein